MPRLAGPLRLVALRRPARRGRATVRARARYALLAFAVSSLAIGVATIAVIEQTRPDVVDRESARRHALLAERIAEDPSRPLVLTVGSSRTVMGFDPQALPSVHDADGRSVLVFNYSHYGAGPILTRVTLARLFAAGVRPRGVVLELMPAFLARENARFISASCTAREAVASDAFYNPGELLWEYVRERGGGVPGLVRRATREPDIDPSLLLNPLGGLAKPRDTISPEERKYLYAIQVNRFAWVLRDWKPGDGADRALRETVALCRQYGAKVRFLLMPEGTEHRAMYGPGSWDRVTAYANGLSRELDVPLTDARDWLGEGDFLDSHHALKGGATKLTALLGREAIEPLMR